MSSPMQIKWPQYNEDNLRIKKLIEYLNIPIESFFSLCLRDLCVYNFSKL